MRRRGGVGKYPEVEEGWLPVSARLRKQGPRGSNAAVQSKDTALLQTCEGILGKRVAALIKLGKKFSTSISCTDQVISDPS